MDFDLVVTNGTVVDGTGQPGFRADLGIQDGRIVAVIGGPGLSGEETLDASGLVVAPGFIDIHSHLDWDLCHPAHDQIQAPIVLQGITTAVTGNCGVTPAPVTGHSATVLESRLAGRSDVASCEWRSLNDFLDILEQDGVLLNAAALVGHSTLRYGVMGKRAEGDDATPEEIEAMCDLAREAMREGAFGLSTGLGYSPGRYASTQELLRVLQSTAEEGGLHASHLRSYRNVSPAYCPMILGEPHNVLAVREQLELARRTGVRLQLAHLVFHGRQTWPTYPIVLDDIERAADEGVDVAFDSYAHTFGNTTIKVNFPNWFLTDFENNIDNPRVLEQVRREISFMFDSLGRGYQDILLMRAGVPELAEFEGLDFATIGHQLDMSQFEAYAHVARVSEGTAYIRQYTYSGEADGEDEEPLRAVISHRLCAFNTDASVPPLGRGQINPAAYGTFPRLLGRYSRDLGLFSLEEVIRRMTSFAAEHIGLADMGRIAPGYWGDLVLFDPETVDDQTTLERPDASPTGIEAVLISGHLVAQNGKIVSDKRWGRVLRQ